MIIANISMDSPSPGGYGEGEQVFSGDVATTETWLASYRAINGPAGIPAYWDVWCAKYDVGVKKAYSLEVAKAEMMRLAYLTRLTR